MPKILPALAGAAAPMPPRAGSVDFSTRSASSPGGTGTRADRAGGFDQVLNGARKQDRSPAASVPEDRAAKGTEASKSAKGKPRAERRDDRTAGRVKEAAGEESRDGVSSARDEVPEGRPAETASDASTEPATHGPGDDVRTEDADAAATDDGSARQSASAATGSPAPADDTLNLVDLASPVAEEAVSDDGAAQPGEATATDPSAGLAALLNGAPSPQAPGSTAGGDAAMAGAVAPATGSAEVIALTGAAEPTGQHTGTTTAGMTPTGTAAGEGLDPRAGEPGDGQASARAQTSPGARPVDVLEPVPVTDPPSAAAAAPAPQGASTASTDAATAARALESLVPQPSQQPAPSAAAHALPAGAPELPPEARFADDNHPNIVAGVRGQLMPKGGTMQIRLDPPELGPLSVTIRLNDGVMEASFETTSDQAAKLLSHSLSTLKTSLESQGVSVERLHVQQAPKNESSGQGGNGDQPGQSRDPQQEHAARQEQQRREMLRRMWRRLSGSNDPLDMVA